MFKTGIHEALKVKDPCFNFIIFGFFLSFSIGARWELVNKLHTYIIITAIAGCNLCKVFLSQTKSEYFLFTIHPKGDVLSL